MNNLIGFKIRRLREEQALSQEAMAVKLGILQGTLCKIESGTVEKVDFALIGKICDLFNVDLQYFFENSFSQNNRDNKNSAISIFGNPTVNNSYPDFLLDELKNLIAAKDEQIALLKGLLEKK